MTTTHRRSVSSRDRYQMVVAALNADQPIEVVASRLEVIKDGGAVRLVQKMFFDFVSDEDLSMFPDFLVELDKLFAKYRGSEPITDDEVSKLEKDFAKSASTSPNQKAKEERKAIKDAKIEPVVEKEAPVYDSSLAYSICASLAQNMRKR